MQKFIRHSLYRQMPKAGSANVGAAENTFWRMRIVIHKTTAVRNRL